MNIYQMFDNQPWSYFFTVILILALWYTTIEALLKGWGGLMRYLSIRKHGWPPAHCDADGDAVYEEEPDDIEDRDPLATVEDPRIRDLMLKGELYDRVCKQLGIEKDILGYVRRLKDEHSWQPILSVHRGEVKSIDIWAGQRYANCRWHEGEGWQFRGADGNFYTLPNATHWRRIPSPPEA